MIKLILVILLLCTMPAAMSSAIHVLSSSSLTADQQGAIAMGYAMSRNPDGYHIRTVPTKGERGMIDGFEIKVPCACDYEDYLRITVLVDKGDFIEILREYPGASVRSLPAELKP